MKEKEQEEEEGWEMKDSEAREARKAWEMKDREMKGMKRKSAVEAQYPTRTRVLIVVPTRSSRNSCSRLRSLKPRRKYLEGVCDGSW